MTDTVSKDNAAKARIIKHMNADHQQSLSYYLQHFNGLSSFEARNALITDITFDYMTFRISGGNTSSLPLYPPMTSWADARSRTVELDRIARTALGISSIRITEFQRASSPLHIAITFLILFGVFCFIAHPWIVPGTFIYDKLLPYYPGGPAWFQWMSKVIALPTLAIHVGEVIVLDQTRLRKYGVERFSPLWWKWVGACFVEGFGCFQRIDAMVARKAKEAESKKH